MKTLADRNAEILKSLNIYVVKIDDKKTEQKTKEELKSAKKKQQGACKGER